MVNSLAPHELALTHFFGSDRGARIPGYPRRWVPPDPVFGSWTPFVIGSFWYLLGGTLFVCPLDLITPSNCSSRSISTYPICPEEAIFCETCWQARMEALWTWPFDIHQYFFCILFLMDSIHLICLRVCNWILVDLLLSRGCCYDLMMCVVLTSIVIKSILSTHCLMLCPQRPFFFERV